ncbi:MAG: acyl--CoA ligase [Acidimicrobiia bacterium]|nr:acyl--CoA ligase [Acidimicrobiia bacterium]MDH5238007.1 acyl--CoA ligase [Acidimicrobiia bacterium]
MTDDVLLEVRAELTGPGGLFEITTEDVRGRPMEVFANRKRSLREYVEAAAAHGGAEHLVLGTQRITFATFTDQVAAVGAALREHYGVGPGDRVAIFSANRPEWAIAYWATVSLGGVVAALNGWWTTDEVTFGVEMSEPKVLFGDTRRLARLGPQPDEVTVVDLETEFGPLRSHAHAGLPDQPIDEDDPATLLFTSGTTGRPKGALISHRGLIGFVDGMVYNGAENAFVAARRGEADLGAPRPQMVTLATSPMFHVSGLFAGVIMGLALGAKLVLREGRFDPVDVLRLIEEEKITSWSAMGSMGPRVLACPDLEYRDTASVTNIGFGGAPVSDELRARLREAFPASTGNQGMGYGSSESVAVITSIGGQDFLDHPDSCGRVNRTFELQIRDEDGHEVADGVEGLIHVRSPYTMLGYWKNDEATAETVDADGWLNMGDVGRVEDGWLIINSRARDMILRAAENIYPVEIEHRLDAHPDVSESAVLGVDHPELGQEIKAIVVPSGPRFDPEALAAWVGEALSAHKVPSIWERRAEPLPRNAAGKVVKGVLTGDQQLGQVEE